MDTRPRIGIVGYVNAHPLTDALDRERLEVIDDHPSVIARMLAKGEVDVALCPVAAVLSDDDYRIVPGWCIGSEGPVTSVLLVAETPPEQWREVVLDGVSRTSVTLARLLLQHGPLSDRVRADLVLTDGAAGSGVDAARGDVASVVIGDVARDLPERLTHRIDLAEAWKAWTGLPFVFAVWAGRPGLRPEVIEAIREAGATGVAQIPSRYEGLDLAYVSEALRYPLDDRALMGLRRFAALAFRHGLVQREEVSLFGPAETFRPRIDVDDALEKALVGVRIDRDEALCLYHEAALPELGFVADQRRQALHPDKEVAWGLRALGPDASELVAAGVGSVALTGRLDVEAVRDAARRHPGARLVGGAPGDSVAGLAAAGLNQVHDDPVGLLVDPARLAMMDTWWAEVAREGLDAVATVVVGRGETPEELVDTLLALRRIQEAHGVFRAARVWAAFGDGALGAQANTAVDHLRATALARLVLDNVASLQAAPDTEGLGMAQASLRMGCDHLGYLPVERVEQIEAVKADVAYHLEVAGFTGRLEGPEPVAVVTPGVPEARC